MWFIKKIKSSEYIDLSTQIQQLSIRLSSLEIELQLYVKKLRLSKGWKSLKEEEETEPEDIKDEVLLGSDGSILKKNK